MERSNEYNQTKEVIKMTKKQNEFLTYKEAGEEININPSSISTFATKHNITRGTVKIGGRNVRVVNKNEFEYAIYEMNYLRNNDKVVWDES